MNRLVWDPTALYAFFHEHRQILTDQWWAADERRLQLLWPAAAVASANFQLGAAWSSWHPMLLNRNVTCLPLGESSAVAAGVLHHDVVTAHVAYVSREYSGLIVTTDPQRYAGLNVPVLPV